MVKLVSLYLLGTHKQNFQYSMLNFSWTCFFSKQFQSHCVYKVFSYTKSKSRIGGYCPGGSCLESIIFGVIIRGPIIRRVIIRGNFPGEIVLGSNCLGGNHPVGNYQGGHFPRGQTNIIWCFFSLKFKNSLFRKKLFRCRFLSKRTV